MRKSPFVLFFLFFSGCVQKATLPLQKPEALTPPTRLLVLVFDQLRPDLIDRYEMKTFQKLQKEGITFPNAFVGHLSSATVVSHAVLSTGVLPKKLPWQSNTYRDSKGRFFNAHDLGIEKTLSKLKPFQSHSLAALLKNAPRASLPDGEAPPPWGPVFTIAQKDYAAATFGGPASDTIITLGKSRSENPFKGWRAPVGKNVPEFMLNPLGGRYFVDSRETYGSEKTSYPLDGNRFMPASDPAHIGGDAWVATAAIEYMKQNKDWRAGFLSFGAIDKVLHMLGEHESDTQENWALQSGATLRKTLQRADGALSALLTFLQEEGLLAETVIAITADHGGQATSIFHGSRSEGHALTVYGKGENFDRQKLPEPFRPLKETGLLQVADYDSLLRFWLSKDDAVSVSKFARLVKNLPGVSEVYVKQKTGKNIHYIRYFRSPDLKGEALEWAKEAHLELVETLASPEAPEVLGLLFDGHGYGLPGEHGGAQKPVQSIPMILYSPVPSQRGRILDMNVRLVDVSPMVLKIMGISAPRELDGSAQTLNGL